MAAAEDAATLTLELHPLLDDAAVAREARRAGPAGPVFGAGRAYAHEQFALQALFGARFVLVFGGRRKSGQVRRAQVDGVTEGGRLRLGELGFGVGLGGRGVGGARRGRAGAAIASTGHERAADGGKREESR